MKQVKVILEFDEETLGEKWMNVDNLKTLLYTMNSTGEHLLKVITFEESETAKAVGHDLLVKKADPQACAAAEKIVVAHIDDGIKEYNKERFERCHKILREEIIKLLNKGIDLKRTDCITVFDDDGDINFYTIKERTFDASYDGDGLMVTYWVR